MIKMDFNSNDEYLKAFLPKFGPKLEGLNMSNQLPHFETHKLHHRNQQAMVKDDIEESYANQVSHAAYLYKELECTKVQEAIQANSPIFSADHKGDDLLKARELLTLGEEDLPPTREISSLAQPKINEPLLKVQDTRLDMEVQRDSEMVLGDFNGDLRVETAPSLQGTETRVLDRATCRDIHQLEGPAAASEILQNSTRHWDIPAEDVVPFDVIKDSTFALDNVGPYDTEKPISMVT